MRMCAPKDFTIAQDLDGDHWLVIRNERVIAECGNRQEAMNFVNASSRPVVEQPTLFSSLVETTDGARLEILGAICARCGRPEKSHQTVSGESLMDHDFLAPRD